MSVSPASPKRLPSPPPRQLPNRSEEHTSELQSRPHLVCRLLLEKKKNIAYSHKLNTYFKLFHSSNQTIASSTKIYKTTIIHPTFLVRHIASFANNFHFHSIFTLY